jgi:Fe2+ or Zn2+ uptake regulation protein
MEQPFENITEKLSQKQIKPSHQRIKVLEYLIAHQDHPTVDQIFNHLQREIPTLSKSTIYNTLNVFIEAELVRVITIDDNETRYDILMENHGHFKCESCATIYNFKINIDDFATDELNEFKINNKNVYFRGICPRCFQNKK